MKLFKQILGVISAVISVVLAVVILIPFEFVYAVVIATVSLHKTYWSWLLNDSTEKKGE